MEKLFKNLFDFQKKSNIKAGEGFKNGKGKYPFFTSSNELNKSIDSYLFDDSSLIFGTGGNASIHYYNGKFAVSTDCLVAVPKNKELVWPKFVYHYLSGNLHILENGFKGAGLKHISKEYISNLKIPLPPLPEQQRIAKILDAADSLRKKTQQIIDSYDELAQSIFLDMFGDPVKNSKGWEKKTLKELGEIKTGNTPPREDPTYYNDNFIEWIKTDNINTPDLYLTSAKEYLSEKGLKKGRCVEANSILVTCIAGSKKVIGNVAITGRKVAFNQQINSFTPLEGDILFFYYMFKIGKSHIQNFSTNGMKGIITKSKFETIDFITVPSSKQFQFSSKIQLIEKQKELAKQSLKESEDLFQSLLQKAFKGELNN